MRNIAGKVASEDTCLRGILGATLQILLPVKLGAILRARLQVMLLVILLAILYARLHVIIRIITRKKACEVASSACLLCNIMHKVTCKVISYK